jgi:hypothetical protein
MIGMSEFTLREYPQEKYEADMKKLLKEKGLYDAVDHFADRINSLASVLNYGAHREVQECLCDILFLIDLDKGGDNEQ